MREMLTSLLKRPTFEEQWPEEYQKARTKAKWRMRNIDSHRGGMRFEQTLLRDDVRQWWDNIL